MTEQERFPPITNSAEPGDVKRTSQTPTKRMYREPSSDIVIRRFLYVRDDGTQYLPEGGQLGDELHDLPSDVSELWAEFVPTKTEDSFYSAKMAARKLASYNRRSGRNGVPDFSLGAEDLLEMEAEEFAKGVVNWSLLDEAGNPVPCTRQTLEKLKRNWMYAAFKQLFQEINTVQGNSQRP